METKNIVIEKCQIEEFDETASEFMREVFDLDYAKMLVTDISDLRDFSYSGKLPEGALDPKLPLKQLNAIWDKWVIARVQAKYGISLTTTVVNLVWLFNRIEQTKNAKVH